MATIVKYFSLIFCCFYIYLKLLNLHINKKQLLQSITIFMPFCLLCYLIRPYIIGFVIFLMALFFTLFAYKFLKTPLRLCVTVSCISFGLSYLSFFFSDVIIAVISTLIEKLIGNDFLYVLTLIFLAPLQFLLSTIPFRFRRLQRGMPFLQEHVFNDRGVYISILILFAFSYLSTSTGYSPKYIIPLFLSFAFCLTLLFWWKNSISKSYLDKVRAKELSELDEIIRQKEEEIEKLKYHNEELARIIHKDNKLIPAMAYSVREYLLTAKNDITAEERLKRGTELLGQLENMTKERSGILNTYEQENKSLPSTEVPSIDSLLSYMLEKANISRIDFDLTISGSTKYLIRQLVAESDLKTLLADLIENAIIATKRCEKRKIMTHIGMVNDFYAITVFDSGEPFTAETLLHAGIEKASTHLSEGGSGIGLMSTFEIAKKYNASFVIEEFAEEELYSKSVSVCFDETGQYRIKTQEPDKIQELSKRQDILLYF